jgi:hypothetical protein
MKKTKLFFAALLLTTSLSTYAQMPAHTATPKLIAVVNSATWCGVCKANSERFGALLMSYSKKGVNIYLNDLSNEKTKDASKQELEKDHVYDAVVSTPRKGMGKALKACRIVKDKKQSGDISGIVTFIDPNTHKQLKQISIATADAEMNNVINNLLN